MAIAAAAVIVPVGVLFFISGLVTNAIQVQLYTDPETFKLMGKEHALLISNHRSDIDWVVGWVLAQVIGWSMFFSEYLFLERSWAKDESTLKSGLERLQDYPLPFWLALFVEGTRFTQAKLLAAQEYAASTGLPIPRNVLIPRTKGFVTAVNHMRSFVPAIYEVTVAIPKSSPAPTMLRIFKGQPSVGSVSIEHWFDWTKDPPKRVQVHIHLKRHMMKDLPENDDDIAQWCRDVFVAKDKLLDKHIAEDSFGEEQLQNIGRPAKSLVVVVCWACLLIVGAIKLFQSSALLSSWKGITVSATLLAVITILMQILINFTQSERSTPAKVAPAKRQNGKKVVVENGQRKDE
nr:1-acyl-sn-glycerol-3-phosphate acyltransferase 2 [Ipomoea batatas]